MGSLSRAGFLVFDHDLRYLVAQGAGLADVGLSREALEGKTIWEALPPDACRWIEPPYRAALAGEASAVEIPFAGRTFATNVLPVRDAEGAVRCGLVLAEEVTSLERTEEELRNRARYRHLLESITGYSYTTTYFDDRPALTTHSPGVLTVTGYTTEDYSMDPGLWLEMVDPLDRPAVEAHVARALRGEIAAPLEHRIRHRSGDLRWVRNTLVTRRDSETGLLMCDGLIEDVTERRRTELALQQSEARFRMLTEASFEGIGISEDGVVTDVNDQLLAALGYERADMVGRNVADFIAPESRELVAEQRRSNGDAYEHWMLRKDGSRVLMDARGRTIEAGGRKLRVTALRDITEKRRAEQALRESEERFRTLAEGSTDGIFLADAQGHYQDVNAAGARMLGYTRDDVLTLSIPDVVAPDEVARVAPEVGRLRTDGIARSEWHFQRKDGSSFEGEVDGHLLSDGRLLGVLRDITERRLSETHRREFERRLQDTQRLEALGTLAGGVAHDFNNILAAIFGQLELARMDLATDHPVQRALADVGEMAERARDLVRQILAFSRPPNDLRRAVRLETQVEEAVRMLRVTLPATLEVRTEVAASLPPVQADPSQMQQVIVNLCTNAWHAIGDVPGCITLRVSLEEFDAACASQDPRARQGRFVVLSVSDTGSGMDAETLSRIFEPFFTTKASQGTGLGLAVVHGIVRAHGGFVLVQSERGRGSAFRVHLPVSAESSAVSPQPSADAGQKARGERILFLDDEVHITRVCSRLLERTGYKVTTFQLPLEALRHFERDPGAYDCIITDLSMPEMDGVAFARAVRRARPNIPIILATGYAKTNEKGELGVDAIINKPLRPDEFVAAVRWVIKRALSA